ncbi:MAG: hypothetical protein R3F19_27595 [Verrucomicrobiales bacterium]
MVNPRCEPWAFSEGYTGFVIHDYLSSYYRITGIPARPMQRIISRDLIRA